jgi:hypothetical protein
MPVQRLIYLHLLDSWNPLQPGRQDATTLQAVRPSAYWGYVADGPQKCEGERRYPSIPVSSVPHHEEWKRFGNTGPQA